MESSEKFSFRKRLQSFIYAFNGIIHMLKHEHNARLHFTALAGAIIFGILFKINPAEWATVTVVAGLVLIAELFNTAIERLADITDSEWNIKIGVIKDYSAGAVLIAAIISFIVGSIIFIPKIIAVIVVFINH